jgi:hypothetical protein
MGVVRMAKVRLPWRALRPVLLAGAATLTWLTLSGTAATADSTDSNSLLGGLTASVTALAAPVTDTLPSLPAAAPPASPASAPSGLLEPVVGTLSGTGDQLVASVPVVNTVVPAGTVSAVSVPVAAAADDAAIGVVETVAPPLVEAVPVLEPVIQPVSDLVTGAAPLPVTLPGLPDGGTLPAASESVLAATPSAVLLSPGDAASASVGKQLLAADPAAGFQSLPAALAGTSSSPTMPTAAVHSADPAQPHADDPSPYAALGAPGSGTGSGASASGASGSAAWLNDFALDFLLPESFPVSGTSEHAPLPVSFDPGSSPD